MKRAFSLLLVLGAAALACDDEGGGKETTQPPPPPEEGGALGAATFRYKCLLASDAQCDFDAELGTGTGGSAFSLPPVALGSRFQLDFQLKPSAPPGGAPEVAALHPTFATVGPDGIAPLKAGKTTIALRRGVEIVDIVDITIVDPVNLKVFTAEPSGEFRDVSVSSGGVTFTQQFTFRFRVAAADAENKVLAGSFPCKWTSDNPAVANIETPPEDNIATIKTGTPGTAKVTVELGSKKLEIPITVGG